MFETRKLKNAWETLESEELKRSAQLVLHGLAKSEKGRQVIDLTRRTELVEDPRLEVELQSLHFDNCVMVGAGWVKDGLGVDGLLRLGFSGVEIGSVLLHPQYGNPKPRMWYNDGAGLNRLGFNSTGAVAVAENLSRQKLDGVVGINISRNKLSPENQSPAEFALVAQLLYEQADYFAINFQSPNTPGLRDSMMRLLKDSFIAVDEAQATKGPKKPIFIKTSVDMSEKDIFDTIAIADEVGAAGIIDTNTTSDDDLKTLYGWQGEMGGLSGDNPELRRRAVERMKIITKHSQGSGLARIGVGAISDSQAAIERIHAGAQIVQVVTGLRQNKAKTATNINKGILAYMDYEGIRSIEEMIGIAA